MCSVLVFVKDVCLSLSYWMGEKFSIPKRCTCCQESFLRPPNIWSEKIQYFNVFTLYLNCSHDKSNQICPKSIAIHSYVLFWFFSTSIRLWQYKLKLMLHSEILRLKSSSEDLQQTNYWKWRYNWWSDCACVCSLWR